MDSAYTFSAPYRATARANSVVESTPPEHSTRAFSVAVMVLLSDMWDALPGKLPHVPNKMGQLTR